MTRFWAFVVAYGLAPTCWGQKNRDPEIFARFTYGFNFFAGADSLSTTFRGMGSTSPSLTAGCRFYWRGFYFAPAAGLQHFEYRLAQPRLPFHDGERFSAPLDATPGRERQKSKISWLGLRFSPEIGWVWEKFHLSLSGHFDLLLHARRKYRYRSADEGKVVHILVGNRRLQTLPYKLGVTLAAHYSGIGAFFSVFPTPFWAKDGPGYPSFQTGLSLVLAPSRRPLWTRKDRKS
jgi:hypothetical protein